MWSPDILWDTNQSIYLKSEAHRSGADAHWLDPKAVRMLKELERKLEIC